MENGKYATYVSICLTFSTVLIGWPEKMRPLLDCAQTLMCVVFSTLLELGLVEHIMD